MGSLPSQLPLPQHDFARPALTSAAAFPYRSRTNSFTSVVIAAPCIKKG